MDVQRGKVKRKSGERAADAALRATLFPFHVSCFTHLHPSLPPPILMCLWQPLCGCVREKEMEGKSSYLCKSWGASRLKHTTWPGLLLSPFMLRAGLVQMNEKNIDLLSSHLLLSRNILISLSYCCLPGLSPSRLKKDFADPGVRFGRDHISLFLFRSDCCCLIVGFWWVLFFFKVRRFGLVSINFNASWDFFFFIPHFIFGNTFFNAYIQPNNKGFEANSNIL